MDAKPLSIGKILSERQRFIVPIYQRTYDWGERQLEPLIDQIEGKPARSSQQPTPLGVRRSSVTASRTLP